MQVEMIRFDFYRASNCVSVSVTLVIRTRPVQDIEIFFTPYDRAMFLVSGGRDFLLLSSGVESPRTSVLIRGTETLVAICCFVLK